MLVGSLHPEVVAIEVSSLHFHHRHLSFHREVLPSFAEQTSFFREQTTPLDSIALVVITDKSLALNQMVASFSKAVASAISLPFRFALLHQTTVHCPKVSEPFLAYVKVFDITLVLTFRTILRLRSTAV